ncbi:MAG: hypothetical protein ACYCO5_12515, partial [Acidobacteriaceae bacterium]
TEDTYMFTLIHTWLYAGTAACRTLVSHPSTLLLSANIVGCLAAVYFCLPTYVARQARLALLLALLTLGAVGAPAAAVAQNLGQEPAIGVAVQGETAAQPEGTLLNAMNWLGNVICPVAAGGTLVGTVAKATTGGKWTPWAVGTAGLLSVSGGLRLVEYFIMNGRGGVM